MRVVFLCCLGWGLMMSGGVGMGAPNVLLIVADDLGWADLGCYHVTAPGAERDRGGGSDLHETPNLDALAASGVRFTDAYAASPVCTPTRASIQTGLAPARVRMTIWRESAQRRREGKAMLEPLCEEDLSTEYQTLGELFSAAGYVTAHVGKWHLGGPTAFPEAHGYRISVGGNIWGAPDSFFYPFRGAETFKRDGFRYVPGLSYAKEGDVLTDVLTDEAIRVMDFAQDLGEPFFLCLSYYTVHTPIEAVAEDVAYFEGKVNAGMRHQNATYAAMVRSLDENVGRLLEHLWDAGMEEETIVVFLSDNGGFDGKFQGRVVTNNAPLRSGKGSCYEGGIRIPLIVRWPGDGAEGGVCAAPVITTDLFASLGEMAGVWSESAEGAGRDGESFAALVREPGYEMEERGLYFHYPHYYHNTGPVSAMRRGDWKLLMYYEPEGRRVELYDLGEDLGEARDLSDTMVEKAGELRGELEGWLEEVGAQLPETAGVENDGTANE
ncbi:MAG: sulfatase [Verrucomicrobiota bacterium]